MEKIMYEEDAKHDVSVNFKFFNIPCILLTQPSDWNLSNLMLQVFLVKFKVKFQILSPNINESLGRTARRCTFPANDTDYNQNSVFSKTIVA